MMKIAMSRAAAALFRALLNRAGDERDRILLSDFRSTDWRSLTFDGERHRIRLRILGQDSLRLAGQLRAGLEDAEFSIPGHFVADIALTGEPRSDADGTVTMDIEALTIAE